MEGRDITTNVFPDADFKIFLDASADERARRRTRQLRAQGKKADFRSIRDAIAAGRHPYGMFTFDQCLTDLVKEGLITYEQALQNSTNADEFVLYFQGISEGSKDSLWESGEYPTSKAQHDGAGLELDRTSRRR